METTKEWSDLPKELWPAIGNRLDNRLDVLRFRSVCKTWRSSVSPFQQPVTPPLPLSFSSPPAAEDGGALQTQPKALLFQIKVYRMESLVGEKPNSSKPWVVKFEESSSGDLRLLHPISNKPLRFFPASNSLKEFNLLDFKMVELRKSYSLQFRNGLNVVTACVNKVVVMDAKKLNDCGIFMICNGGKLGFLRFGDEKWTHVDEQNSHYDDLIVYKGQCYVVDRWGTISWVNSDLNVIQFSPPLCGFGGRKHLVESCGDLFVVDRYLDKCEMERFPEHNVENENVSVFGPNFQAPPHRFAASVDGEAVDFKVYRLDQEWGRWVDVKNLGDQVFILSNDGSFAVSTKDFGRVKGNCILFTDQKLPHLHGIGGSKRCNTRVFMLESGIIRDGHALSCFNKMLHPPSSWLRPVLDFRRHRLAD
ncbi:putative F-box protein At1g65770 [Pyrus communis]|uniref:putative F-box protein At1g65770 n=1 Tax=Pyrus communis TaxID=23211 RepID=UPI0035C001DE